MTEQLEHELRHLFAEDAERAPAAVALAEEARRRVRQRRRARHAMGAGALVAASVAVAAIVGGGVPSGPPPAGERVATPPVTSLPGNPTPGFRPTGALADGNSARCVESYSPSAVAGRAFAFDGTVIAIDAGRTNRPGKGRLDLAAVTFSVNEWFAGGSGATVTVDMAPPIEGRVVEGWPTSYTVGTRILVGGEPRWDGAPLADALAWGCGFSRYYDKETADSWRAATN